jgi:hypothetical protein
MTIAMNEVEQHRADTLNSSTTSKVSELGLNETSTISSQQSSTGCASSWSSTVSPTRP